MSVVGAAYDELFCEVRMERAERCARGEVMDPALEREQWAAVLAVLQAYTSQENLTQQREPVSAFPVEVADFIGMALEELLSGRMPETFKALGRSGAPTYSRIVRSAIDTAVLYANAARVGLVIDHAPAKTVQALFNISERTWKDWRSKANQERAKPENFRVGQGLEDARRSALLVRALHRAAREYEILGRPDYPQGGANKP